MNEKIKEFLLNNYQKVIIIIAIISLGVGWNLYQSAKTDYNNLIKQITITETIKQTEARLSEVKNRELQYKELELKTNSLMKSLNILEAKQRELEKRKKEVIANEIKNYTQDDIRNALANIGLSSDIK